MAYLAFGDISADGNCSAPQAIWALEESAPYRFHFRWWVLVLNRSMSDVTAGGGLGVLDLFVFGAGQIADVIGSYFRESGSFREVFYVVDDDFVGHEAEVDGPILGWDEGIRLARPDDDLWFTAISFKMRNRLRFGVAQRILELGFSFASYVHPTTTLWDGFQLPANTIIMENNVLQRKVSLGANSIVWSNNHVGHHTSIGANTFISSEVCISGNCEIRDGCFFGVNSTLYDGVRVGNEAIVGAGSVVTSDVPDNGVISGPRSV